MKRYVLAVSILVLIISGCSSRRTEDIEWRPAKGYHETEDKKKALATAKEYLAQDIKGVLVAFEQDDNAELSHIEYDIVSEKDGYKITGYYIALYHSTGRLSGFPGGYFVIKISKDGRVKIISSGES